MAKLFFLLSGEHETLPASELKAVIDAEGYAYKVLEELDQVLRLEADLSCVNAVERRAALTKVCGLELFSCNADIGEIVKTTNLTGLDGLLSGGESFAVRVKRVKNYSRGVDGVMLERKLGELVLNKTAGTKVGLKQPDKTFIGVLTCEKFVFGLKLYELQPKRFIERCPKRKPFFHPSAMSAKLARCMVNLAKPKVGDLVFDPFCGTGSILIEAALIGCRVLGLDIQKRMAIGSLKNLSYFNVEPEGIVIGDAVKPPVMNVDCVVTDPPYGRSATTMKRTAEQVIDGALKAVYDVLGKGKRVCLAAPKTLNVGGVSTAIGYEHLESHFVRVHGGLTREIAVFKKV